MRKILFSLVAVVATLASVVGATRAVFSDTAKFEVNSISTATVDIDARSEPDGLLPKPLVVSGLVPGQWTGWSRGIVYNTANSSPVRVFMYVNNLQGTCDKVNLQVYTGNAANGASSERSIVLYNGLLSGLNASSRVEMTGAGKIFNPTLPVNTSLVMQQSAQLDSQADNSYQGKTCTWDEVFVAETPTI